MPRIVARDDATAAFFDGAADGQFLLRYSPVSGRYYEPSTSRFIEGADAELEWKAAAGGGSVVSWVVPHVKTADGVERTVTAIIEFDEGPWWWGPLVDIDPDAVSVGMRVQVAFEQAEGSEPFPVFHPE